MPKRPRPLIEYWPGYGRRPFYYSVSELGLIISQRALARIDIDIVA